MVKIFETGRHTLDNVIEVQKTQFNVNLKFQTLKLELLICPMEKIDRWTSETMNVDLGLL